MGCCGDRTSKFSTMEFVADLYTLEPQNKSGTIFLIKKLESQKFDKVLEKTLKDHLSESKILKNPIFDEKFQFNISNALFYCYLNDNPIVKNYLQVKDLEPFNFETLYKISILLTKNYDKLNLPKINLINKTKFSNGLSDLKVDFSNTLLNTSKIFDPNLSQDLILTKPNLTEELSEIHEEENENDNNSNDQIDEKESENNESEDNSVYDEGEEDVNENNLYTYKR